MSSRAKTLIERISDIDKEDLQYVESDLCFSQLVSLGFLLYGRERSHCEFILQKIIIISQHPPQGKGFKETDQLPTSDILRNYTTINPQNWREHIVEALAIIRAKRVLRKLGLPWKDIFYHYLPHVSEISVNIHPMLKALYHICERINIDQTISLINTINTKYDIHDFCFNDNLYLEVFMLNWLTKRIIEVGDEKLRNSNIEILIEYSKNTDIHIIKDILLETIHQSMTDDESAECEMLDYNNSFKDSGVFMSPDSNENKPTAIVNTTETVESNQQQHLQQHGIQQQQRQQQQQQLHPQKKYVCDASERYAISTENAGYILIINQNTFHEEKDVRLKEFLPKKKLSPRKGTDVDRDRLKATFTQFGYIPLVYDNLTHLEMLHYIRETVKRSLLKDSLIVCILSHGMEGVVYGCNSIPIAINEIQNILANSTLSGKPKMVIIQACQKEQSPLDISTTNYTKNFKPNNYAGTLLALSAIQGTNAVRHTLHGSWFVESLCKCIEEYGDCKHLLDILTKVAKEISEKVEQTGENMLPFNGSTLLKEFYLPPRVCKKQ